MANRGGTTLAIKAAVLQVIKLDAGNTQKEMEATLDEGVRVEVGVVSGRLREGLGNKLLAGGREGVGFANKSGHLRELSTPAPSTP